MLQCVVMRDGGQGALELASASEAETVAIGRRIGERLAAGDLVLLLAPFGAGKTHLTKGIATGLGADPDDVNSPSFVLINEYAAGPDYGSMPIYHVDLYRVETPHELETVGLEECLQGDGVCVIEWAERAAGWLPQDRLVVEIEETGPQARRLRLVPHGRRYAELVAGLAPTAEGGRQKAE
jgi:tRNA threonylcarbamoyladenosine biosynthesis protein TsaE